MLLIKAENYFLIFYVLEVDLRLSTIKSRVVATISLFKEVHAWNRANLQGYFEVYFRVSLEETATWYKKCLPPLWCRRIQRCGRTESSYWRAKSIRLSIRIFAWSICRRISKWTIESIEGQYTFIKTELDYTRLAHGSPKRSNCADSAIDVMLSAVGINRGDIVSTTLDPEFY